MNPGLSSFAFGWAVQIGRPPMNEAALFEFAHRHRVPMVQLGDNLPLHCRSPEARAILKGAAQRLGLRVELGARGLTEAHLQTYLDLCVEQNCSLLRFVADAQGHEPSLVDLTAMLRNAMSALANARVTLGLENHDRFPASALRRLVDDIGSAQIGICLDTANSLGAGEGLAHVAEVLAPVAVNVHIKDVAIRRLPHQMGFVVHGCPLGQGQLPIRQLIDRLRALGYRGSVLLESWSPPGANDTATVADESAAVDASLTTLKQWLAT